MALVTREGLLMAIGLTLLPLLFLWVLVKLLPPWLKRTRRSRLIRTRQGSLLAGDAMDVLPTHSNGLRTGWKPSSGVS